MITLNKSLVPLSDREDLQRVMAIFNRDVQWMINLEWDEQQSDKLKQANQIKLELQEKAKVFEKEEPGGFGAKQIAVSLRK